MSAHVQHPHTGPPVPSVRAVRAAPAAAVSIDELEDEIRQLKIALTGRAVIDQAKGVLMRHFAIDAEAAFQLMVRWSSHSHAKVSALAQEITTTAVRGDDAVARAVEVIQRRGHPARNAPRRERRTASEERDGPSAERCGARQE